MESYSGWHLAEREKSYSSPVLYCLITYCLCYLEQKNKLDISLVFLFFIFKVRNKGIVHKICNKHNANLSRINHSLLYLDVYFYYSHKHSVNKQQITALKSVLMVPSSQAVAALLDPKGKPQDDRTAEFQSASPQYMSNLNYLQV